MDVAAKALSALEFHKVKEQLTEHAASSLGKEMLLELKPSRSLEEVKSCRKKSMKQEPSCV